MKVALLNVKYSANLGDGLLSECLEGALASALGRVAGAGGPIVVESIDLAGRTGFSSGSGLRGTVLKTLEGMPDWVRQPMMYVVLKTLVRTRLRKFYADSLAGVDAVVLGGGNLLADSDLNFPIKIEAALAEATRRGLPVAVFGVGVTRNWTRTGTRLFARAFSRARLIDVTVRDTRSQAVWNDLLAGRSIQPAGLACDPGLLAASRYGDCAASDRTKPVGFCITDPLLLRYHGEASVIGSDLAGWYADAISALANSGREVVLFTNGSPEDRAFLDTIAPALVDRGDGRVRRAEDFTTPGDLVRFIGGCSLVVAHRMHACIAAYALGIPPVGLAWDVKLDSFFALTERSDYVVTPAIVPAARIVALADHARDEPLDPVMRVTLISRGRADVERLAALLVDAAR